MQCNTTLQLFKTQRPDIVILGRDEMPVIELTINVSKLIRRTQETTRKSLTKTSSRSWYKQCQSLRCYS